MSEIDSVIADTSDKIRGDRVDRLIYEEAGSNKYLTKSWSNLRCTLSICIINFLS